MCNAQTNNWNDQETRFRCAIIHGGKSLQKSSIPVITTIFLTKSFENPSNHSNRIASKPIRRLRAKFDGNEIYAPIRDSNRVPSRRTYGNVKFHFRRKISTGPPRSLRTSGIAGLRNRRGQLRIGRISPKKLLKLARLTCSVLSTFRQMQNILLHIEHVTSFPKEDRH